MWGGRVAAARMCSAPMSIANSTGGSWRRPIAFIAYGGVVAAIGGLVVIGALIILQFPAFVLLKRFGVLPLATDEDD